jgi:hypothetical protein
VKKLEPGEILDLTAYEKIRPQFVEKMIALKRPRRIAVGDRLTFIFENRDTVTFQVQEMTRAERTVDDAKIAEEVAVYNELVPDEHQLSATLMIEIPQLNRVRAELDRLVGIDEHVLLHVGDQTVRATFDEKQFEADRISAVQYIKFPLGEPLAKAFCDPTTPVVLAVDHPNYREETKIDGASRESLIGDLRSEVG